MCYDNYNDKDGGKKSALFNHCFTWVVGVYDSKNRLQGGAVAIQSLQQTLLDVLWWEYIKMKNLTCI